MGLSGRVLRISDPTLVSSECWTYYKFAIMQTSDFFDTWLANHMELYIDQNGNAVFGNDGMMYPLSYYSDILNISEKHILDVPAEKVVGFLIKQIDSGNYVILDLNYKRILLPDTNEFQLHETLIYGYDLEKKEFIVPIMKKGVFKENKVSFDVLVKSYQESFNYYQKDINRLFNRRLWFLGITIIQLKKNCDNANKFYDLIRKINIHREGRIYTKKNISSEEGDIGYTFYTGISCLSYIVSLIEASLEDLSIENAAIAEKYRKACLKILESQKMILHLIKWAFTNLKVKDADGNLLIKEYEHCCNKTNAAVLLFYKYRTLKDANIINRILNNLRDSLVIEKKILPDVVELIKKHFIDNRLNKSVCIKNNT